MGLSLYPKEGYSNTVTAFEVPEGFTASQILDEMLEKHNLLLAGSFGCFAGKLIRIGHMGENAYKEKAEQGGSEPEPMGGGGPAGAAGSAGEVK